MDLQNKEIRLVTKLIRLTNANEIQWAAKNPPVSIASETNDFVPVYFEAHYKDKHVAIYQWRSQHLPRGTEHIVFAVLDTQDRVLMKNAEHFPALSDLMTTVREKLAGIDSLLNNDINE